MSIYDGGIGMASEERERGIEVSLNLLMEIHAFLVANEKKPVQEANHHHYGINYPINELSLQWQLKDSINRTIMTAVRKSSILKKELEERTAQLEGAEQMLQALGDKK
jgi:hypothetical protein